MSHNICHHLSFWHDAEVLKRWNIFHFMCHDICHDLEVLKEVAYFPFMSNDICEHLSFWHDTEVLKHNLHLMSHDICHQISFQVGLWAHSDRRQEYLHQFISPAISHLKYSLQSRLSQLIRFCLPLARNCWQKEQYINIRYQYIQWMYYPWIWQRCLGAWGQKKMIALIWVLLVALISQVACVV